MAWARGPGMSRMGGALRTFSRRRLRTGVCRDNGGDEKVVEPTGPAKGRPDDRLREAHADDGADDRHMGTARSLSSGRALRGPVGALAHKTSR